MIEFSVEFGVTAEEFCERMKVLAAAMANPYRNEGLVGRQGYWMTDAPTEERGDTCLYCGRHYKPGDAPELCRGCGAPLQKGERI